MKRDEAPGRRDFVAFHKITTRWMDQDPFGHVNNVEYYSYFDTAVNQHLIKHAGLDPRHSEVVGMVVDTQCSFFKELTFPEEIDVGFRVAKIGNSSAQYEIGIFKISEERPAAFGRLVHVYVDRKTQTPVSIPEPIRRALQEIAVA